MREDHSQVFQWNAPQVVAALTDLVLTVFDSLWAQVSGNTANGDGGGGILNATDATHTLTNSTVSGNTALHFLGGGGILNEGALTLTNSTVSDNTMLGLFGGGGILNLSADRHSTTSSITFCTIYGNRANTGAGMDSVESGGQQVTDTISPVDITVELRNSLVAGNQSQTGFAIRRPLTSDTYNLLQNADPGAIGSTDRMLPANADLSKILDPMLRSNPGPDGRPAPTLTLALHPIAGNPAIDAIPLAACQTPDPATQSPITTDQRGVPRPDDKEPFCGIGTDETPG